MRPVVAIPSLVAAGLFGLGCPPSQAVAPRARSPVASPTAPAADGRAGLLRAAGAKPAATSDGARVAPGPSERAAPAAPEVRQTPAGGEAQSKPHGTGVGKRHD